MIFIILHQYHLGKNYLKNIGKSVCIDQRIGEINDECLRVAELKGGSKKRILAIT
jgi:hypothetical protein